jgi:uncharacterized membrane protein YuzA (DUF378 family)
MKALHQIAWWLLVIGGLNWGLIGIGGFVGADWNVIHLILGQWASLTWAVYVLVGISALAVIFKPRAHLMGM